MNSASQHRFALGPLGALLLALALCAPAQANLPSTPPDPKRSLYSELAWWDREPFHFGTLIGHMYRPLGLIRRVTWYHGSFLGGLGDDPPGWERRAHFEYDREGRTTLVEESSMGHLDQRSVVERGPSVAFEYDDELGTVTKLDRDVDGVWRETLWCRFDGAGRIVEAVSCRGGDGSFQSKSEYDYDDDGNVRELRLTHANGAVSTLSFELDQQGRLTRRRMARADGSIYHDARFSWSEAGRLLASDVHGDGTAPEWNFCTYDGASRMLSSYWMGEGPECSVRDLAYEDDARGNWVLQLSRADSTKHGTYSYGPSRRRDIEYWD